MGLALLRQLLGVFQTLQFVLETRGFFVEVRT